MEARDQSPRQPTRRGCARLSSEAARAAIVDVRAHLASCRAIEWTLFLPFCEMCHKLLPFFN